MRWKTSSGPRQWGRGTTTTSSTQSRTSSRSWRIPASLVRYPRPTARVRSSIQQTSPPSTVPSPVMRPQIGIPAARKAASCAAGSVRRCGLPMLQRITPRSQTMDTSRAYRESRPTVWSGGRRSVSTAAASSSARKCSYSAHAAAPRRLPGLAPGVSGPTGQLAAPFELEEVTIAALQAGLESGKYTARSLVTAYLQRIDELDRKGPTLRAVLEANPDALTQAAALDAERKAKGPRGPLHGIPVLVKDNVATRDRMQSTAGSLALSGVTPPRDAFLVERLRAAGAVLLGKANLSEWANFRSTRSSSGWSGRGGQCRNPYALDRTPSGSSSGSAVAVAASLCAAAIGTETDGSIVSASTCCSIVGITPTLALVTRAGVTPIANNQDTAGPMARTVADAATLLGALPGVDPHDDATAASPVLSASDFPASLAPAGLKGARLGV